MADCYDRKGNKVPCDQVDSNWKKSTDLSKGSEMKEIYTPSKSTKKDPKVYDKLQSEIDSGFAKAKYGFEGTDLNKYIKAKRTDQLYRSPSKNKQQTQTLERINKREGSIFVDSTPELKTITIDKDPSGVDGTEKEKTNKSSNSISNKYSVSGGEKITGRSLYECNSDDPTACGLDMAKQTTAEQKAETKAYNKAQKDRIYKVKADGTQKLKKTFDPKGWLQDQKLNARNRSNKRIAKRSSRRNRRSLF